MLAEGVRAGWAGPGASGGHDDRAGAPRSPYGCSWRPGPAWDEQAAAGSPGGGSGAVGGAAKPEVPRAPPGGGGGRPRGRASQGTPGRGPAEPTRATEIRGDA